MFDFSYFIREARVEDVDTVQQLILDLAAFERASEFAKATPDLEYGCMDWSVMKWNQPAIDFYQRTLGTRPMPDSM
ncbi:hypothetical protein AcW1_009521 [Taiwanofungus camphoratus]|nr:hypothetical protein AcV5_002577 [Antrodia cinnamomea]KAI0947871.1 hypothetical protein AcW1_009521 [Antrodia cinnamomea]